MRAAHFPYCHNYHDHFIAASQRKETLAAKSKQKFEHLKTSLGIVRKYKRKTN
jgi:hypothetical protein